MTVPGMAVFAKIQKTMHPAWYLIEYVKREMIQKNLMLQEWQLRILNPKNGQRAFQSVELSWLLLRLLATYLTPILRVVNFILILRLHRFANQYIQLLQSLSAG